MTTSSRDCQVLVVGAGPTGLVLAAQLQRHWSAANLSRARDSSLGLEGEAGDQHGVLVIGLVEGQVISPPRPRAHRRLHAHERQISLSGQLADHPPPVPGRLDRDGHAGEPAAVGRSRAQSSAAPSSQARRRNVLFGTASRT